MPTCPPARLPACRLTQNALRDLPEGLAVLGQLRALVAGNNVFKRVPPVVCQLQGLEQLFLNLCPIRQLAPELGALTGLQWL